MAILKKSLTNLILWGCLLASVNSFAEDLFREVPESDRQEIIKYFQKRFARETLEEYSNGALMLAEDAMQQFKSIMEFPPFEDQIELGRKIWYTKFTNGKYFSDCFANQGTGAAALYPQFDIKTNKVITFEMAVNQCLLDNGESEFSYDDTKTMGALTAYARKLSDGFPMKVLVENSQAFTKYLQGKKLFFERMGQLNLACASCHITYAGYYFRDERLSPALGQSTHFPVFRGGEFLFTLQMRYRRCMEAMRATPLPAGSEELNNLEYFHSFLSNGLSLEASVYRK